MSIHIEYIIESFNRQIEICRNFLDQYNKEVIMTSERGNELFKELTDTLKE